MERTTFFLASAAFCLFLTVAFGSAMTTDCYCDGLPGNQCDYCDEPAPADTAAVTGLQGEYYDAWKQEHDDFHHRWVDMHKEFHAVPRTEEEDAAWHASFDAAHREFHGVLNGAIPQAH